MYFFTIALCLFLAVRGAEVPVEEGVFVLSDDTFSQFIGEHDFSFVEFYAPWCGHCKHLAPVFVKTAASLKEDGVNVVLAKVDCTQQKQICNDVQGYPTLKLITRKGKIIDYDGERTQEAITGFIAKRTGPATTRISGAEKLTEFLEGLKSKVVAYIEEAQEEYAAWLEVASHPSVELFSFAHVDHEFAGDKKGSIQLISNGKEVTYNGPFESASILSWISEHGYPLVDTLTQETWNRATTHPTSKFLATVFYDKEGTVPAFVEEVASQLKGSVIFAASDATQILERWGGSGTVIPSAVVLDFNGAQPELYTWDESAGLELNGETLKAFVDQSIAGTYTSNIKSEPIPAENDEPVRTLVAKNFEQVINDPANTVVLVEFYAPWCGHCKKLAPVLDELGKNFKSNAGVVIAKFDATANTVRKDIKVAGFPTIYAFQNGVHHPYTGGHDLEPLSAFVQQFLNDKPKEEVERIDL